jgi:hypothetical protein
MQKGGGHHPVEVKHGGGDGNDTPPIEEDVVTTRAKAR